MDPNEKSTGEQNGKIEESHDSPKPPGRHAAKTAMILEACEFKDLDALRYLATTKAGLVSDEIRRQAWPLLLGYHDDDEVEQEGEGEEEEEELIDWRLLPKHRDEDQVQLDVDRSFIFYPKDLTSSDLDLRKAELSDLITEVLRRQPHLSYFQGYHDICQVFLLVLEPTRRAPAVARLSALRIRDFMLPTFSQALAQLDLIPAILAKANPKLCALVSGTQPQPFFALSGTLTMYAHIIQEYGEISRVFDVLLAREAVFSVYMFAQIVLQRSEELFEIGDDEPEMIHSTLSKVPKPMNIDTLISNTAKLFKRYPPESLTVWKSISKYSVLKTARWKNQLVNQTLEDGERYFRKQAKELKRAERRNKYTKLAWKYRRPAGAVGLAVLVGLASIWLQKFSQSSHPPGYFGPLFRFLRGYHGH